MSATEISIVRSILKKLNALPGTYARKTWGGPHSGGWPDIVGSHNGRMMALEVKRPGGKPTALQVRELERWAQAGALSGVVTSWDDTASLLNGSVSGPWV